MSDNPEFPQNISVLRLPNPTAKISISIPVSDTESGAMTGRENGDELDWCCSFEQDGVFHYMGSADVLDNTSQNSIKKGYGTPLTIYEDGTSYPYTRTSSQLVTFQTDNAYPTEALPADEYAGNFLITVSTL